MLNPAFSTDRIAGCAPIFLDISHKVGPRSRLLRCERKHDNGHLIQLRNVISTDVQRNDGEVDVLHWLSRAGVEFIAQAAFGHTFGEVDSIDKPSHPLVQAIKQLMCVTHV